MPSSPSEDGAWWLPLGTLTSPTLYNQTARPTGATTDSGTVLWDEGLVAGWGWWQLLFEMLVLTSTILSGLSVVEVAASHSDVMEWEQTVDGYIGNRNEGGAKLLTGQ